MKRAMRALPMLRVLSLGAGVQSTALAILAARGEVPNLNAAIFADTGWEPPAVYRHLQRLEEEILKPARITLYRVSSGNIRADALNPEARFAQMPLHVLSPCSVCEGKGWEYAPRRSVWEFTDDLSAYANWYDIPDDDDRPGRWVETPEYTGRCRTCKGTGKTDGMARRQCTSEYKLKPIRRRVKDLLGAEVKPDGTMGRVPAGLWVEQWVGISTDEADRAERIPNSEPAYTRSRFPLLELGLSREHCAAINRSAGFTEVIKSACVGCPFRTNREWRRMKSERPAEFADAVEFDEAIRKGSARAIANGHELRGEYYLHRSRVPLQRAPIEQVPKGELLRAQGDLVQLADITEFEEALTDDSSLNGCSPFGCVTGEDIEEPEDPAA